MGYLSTILLNISFEFEFYPLLIVAFLAFTIPILLSLFNLGKIPSVIVEILVGYFIGKYVIASFPEAHIESLDFLALSGFMFLMFLGGLEIDVNGIIKSFPSKKIRRTHFQYNPFLSGILFFIISLALSYLGAVFLSKFIPIQSIWYFALIMVTTSVGIILPILKSQNKLNSRYGQMLITSAAVADILSILLFSFTAFILKKGFKPEMLLIIGLFFLFYLLYFAGQRLSRKTFVKKISFQLSHTASQIQIRGTIVLILLFIVLAQFIGTEVMLLGAFLAGLLISVFMNKNRSILLIKLDGMAYGFFIPIFFIMVGVHFDDSALSQMGASPILFLVLLFILLYLIKIIPATLLWKRLFGTRKAISGGILMASRLSLIIAASKIGLDFGIISPGINAAFVLMAVITCIVSPLVYNQLIPREVLTGEKLIIIGGSSTGVLLARRLKMHEKKAIIIEKSKERYEELISKGLKAVHADGQDPEIYRKINLQPENYVVVLTHSEESNLKVCDLLRSHFHHTRIISKSSGSLIEQEMKNLQVEYLDATRIMATTIESLVFRPTTYHALVETFENYHVEDIRITNKNINGHQIKEYPFHKDGQLILIRSGEMVDIPHGDTYLRHGDIVTVMATESAMQDFRNILKCN